MAVGITVDDVPESVRDRLAEKAADRSQSLDDYLLEELQRIAARPSAASLADEIRRRRERESAGTSDPTSPSTSESDADPG